MARNTTLKNVIAAAARLADDDLTALARWLEEEQAARAAAEATPPHREGVVREERRGSVTYRREWVTCGKRGCHCMNGGALHGPYWYAYIHKDGKVRSRYIGKTLPQDTQELLRAWRDGGE